MDAPAVRCRTYDRYAGKDAIEGEWDRKDTVFPHAIRGRPPEVRFYDDLRRTPFADELTLAFALEAMEAHHIGEDEVTDLFAIGFSATDVVGHTYGPDSHETMDQLLRLDAALGRLFKAIDANVGMANTLMCPHLGPWLAAARREPARRRAWTLGERIRRFSGAPSNRHSRHGSLA